MTCCSNCFNDEFLSKQIKDLSKQTGNCDYCKTENIETINPIELSDYFQPLIDLYDVVDDNAKAESISKNAVIIRALRSFYE